MLQIKSFKIGDDANISHFLRNYTLAPDATILITNGEIAIPYEDGKDLTLDQQITRLFELRNKENIKIRMIFEHDKRVMEVKAHGLKEEVKKVQERLENKTGDAKRDRDLKREGEKEIQRFENMIKQAEDSAHQTQAQITDSMIHIAVYDEEIKKLEEALKRD